MGDTYTNTGQTQTYNEGQTQGKTQTQGKKQQELTDIKATKQTNDSKDFKVK